MVEFDARLIQHSEPKASRRKQMVAIMRAALEAVDPAAATRAHLHLDGDTLWVAGTPYDLARYRRIIVVGAGKAGAPMAQALEEILGERISAGHVNVKYGYTAPTHRITLHEAGHPLPDEAGVQGTRRIVQLLEAAGADDLVICLISGGGSALLALPLAGLGLDDLQSVTDALLRAGATINELNAVRKHLDQVKGGRLAALAYPATLVALLLSDVVGNPLDVIASGPTVPDSSTYADAWQIVERYGLGQQLPRAVLDLLQGGVQGTNPETPKAGDVALGRTQNIVVASNDLAARAAERSAAAQGWNTLLLSTYVQGEAREVAKVYAAIAREELASGRPVPRPACIIAGGETTVTVRGSGRGGRNQELALMAAIAIAGQEDIAIACLATDGSDGPTDASGALAEGDTLARARALGLDPWAHLEANDAYPFFAALGDLLLTGPTNTNVNDLSFIFVWA